MDDCVVKATFFCVVWQISADGVLKLEQASSECVFVYVRMPLQLWEKHTVKYLLCWLQLFLIRMLAEGYTA